MGKFCEYVEYIISKASKRMYMLYQVKRSQSERKDLLLIGHPTSVGINLSSMASTLPKYLSDSIEHLQNRDL